MDKPTRAKKISAAGETSQLAGSFTAGAVGGGLSGAAAGTVAGGAYGALAGAATGLGFTVSNLVGWGVGAATAAIGAVIGAFTGYPVAGAVIGALAPTIAGAVIGLFGASATGMLIGGGLGAGLGGTNSALRTKDKIEAQDQQYGLQKDAGRDMMKQAYNKGRTDTLSEYGPKFYAQGAAEMAQMVEQQVGPTIQQARNEAILETTQAFKEQLEARKEAKAHPQFVVPGEAKDGGFVARCCNPEKPGLDSLKKDTSPAGIKLAEAKGENVPTIQ